MFHRNLGKAQMMTYIFSFNLPSTDAIDFAYGANDLLQWQVCRFNSLTIKSYKPCLQAREPHIKGKEFAAMLQNLNLPKEMKIELLNFLRDKLRPILGNKTVYILLILLIIVDDHGEDHEVNVVRNLVMNHLIGHIQSSSVNNLSLDLEIIKDCLETLPTLCNLFQAQ